MYIYMCIYIYICIILKLKTTTLYTEIENHNYCCEEKLRHTGHKPPICGCATARQANVDDTRCFSRCHATGQNQLFKPASISIWQSRKGWDMGGFHSHGGIPISLDGLFHRKSSKNRWFEATPKSSMLIWFSIINQKFGVPPWLWKPPYLNGYPANVHGIHLGVAIPAASKFQCRSQEATNEYTAVQPLSWAWECRVHVANPQNHSPKYPLVMSK